MNSTTAMLPPDLDLRVIARRPLELNPSTVEWARETPVPVAKGIAEGRVDASVVVVTYNNLSLTKLCVASIFANTAGEAYELIVVDNASTDGTPDYLRTLAATNQHVRVILNNDNRGFAPANNQGLKHAAGNVLVLLNNDTIVPPGWLTRLSRHASDPAVGLIGPVTNRIGNEAEIEVKYRTYGEFLDEAASRASNEAGRRLAIPTPCMFCLAMRRQTWEQLGPLDERYERGLFEDDDYAERARAAGLETACAEDVLVHHFGEASFGALYETREHNAIFEANRRRFEAKWGRAWQPPVRRDRAAYEAARVRIQALVRTSLPAGATVAVISKGDDELLESLAEDGRRAWHFPQSDDGDYLPSYPSDSADAMNLITATKRKGAEYLLIPQHSAWWLDHYREMAADLRRRAALLDHADATLFDLTRLPSPSNSESAAHVDAPATSPVQVVPF